MSADQLTAWVGHLLIAGGRAVRMSPPGALAESAPRRAPRSRDGDTFIILITPAPDTRASADFFETLAQMAADTYFGSGGGVTGGLREAMTAINDRVQEQGQAAPSERAPLVEAVALVLRGSEVYAARCGRMFAVLWDGTQLAFLPADRQDPLVVNLPPLGGSAAPDVQLARYFVAPGHTMLLADTSLSACSDDDLQRALALPDIAAVLEQIKTLGSDNLSASVVQFAEPGAVAPAEWAVTPSTRDPREVRAALPTPMHASARFGMHSAQRKSRPPIPRAFADEPEQLESLPSEQAVQEQATPRREPEPKPDVPVDKPVPPMPTTLPEDIAAPEPEKLAVEAPAEAELPVPQQEAVDSVVVEPTPEPDVEEEPEAEAEPGLGARLQGVWSSITPGEELDTLGVPPSTRDNPMQQGVRRVQDSVIAMQRGLFSGLLAIINTLARIFEQILPAPDEDGKQGIPINLAVGMAILIPVVIVVAVVGFALSERGKGEFEVYREQAASAHRDALALSGDSCENKALRDKWVEVLQLARQAERLRPNDMEVLNIRADAQNYLDCYDDVERRGLTLLHEFARDAELVGPILSESGVDLYTLDRANSLIYHDTLTPEGNRLTTRDNDPIIFEGQAIGPYVVGEIFDIEWLSTGGTRHDNVLIAIDRNGVLIAYSLTFFQSAQQVVTEARWVNPVAIAVFNGNLYVLDVGASQIWRYKPSPGAGAYDRAPEEYFNSVVQPDLTNSVDFGIDRNGAIHILFRDGVVRKFRTNVQTGEVEEQPFTYQRQPDAAFKSGYALFVDNDPASSNLYIVDQTNAAIYETSWAGRYNTGYRPRNVPDALLRVTGFYADEVVRNNMYVVAGNKLYHFFRHEP